MPDDFLNRYESALSTQEWGVISPLIHEDVCVTFSDGRVFYGKKAVQAAFENNFTKIQEEKYIISERYWVKKSEEFAVCLYTYEWSGLINGETASGSGRGSSVIIEENGIWLLLIEHLGPIAK